jgi:hypothetical protein
MIDFVIPWVDGNDPEWQKQKAAYDKNTTKDDVNRYRDFDNLQYFFRGVEKYTPWVNKIHFITWGHVPDWLDVNHPKINIVRHTDYLPKEYLPTYSSHPIEINIHRIDGLAENFVYFNDDTFILKSIKEGEFFKNGVPLDIAALDAVPTTGDFSYVRHNNIKLINTHFKKHKALKSNIFKWFNVKYGKEIYRTFALFPWKFFTGFFTPHLPIAFNKSTFIDIWDLEYDVLNETSKNKFRTKNDVNSWLFRYWHLAKGEFVPSHTLGDYYNVSSIEAAEKVANIIKKQKHKIVCVNDNVPDAHFNEIKETINVAFNQILPEKSGFEK